MNKIITAFASILLAIVIPVSGNLLAQCPTPANLSATNITSSSALLSWSVANGAGSYNIKYRISGSTTFQTASSSSNSWVANGLLSATQYEYSVQAVCFGGNGISSSSSFSVPENFTTLLANNPPCIAPANLSASNITATTAMLSWDPTGAALYNIRYRPLNTPNWNYGSSAVNSKLIINLSPLTTYEWQVQSVCGNNVVTISSSWSSSGVFTTQNALISLCPVPTGLASSNVTSNSALLSWNAMTGVAAYNVRIRPVGTQNWVFAASSTNSRIVNNLTASTQYEWQVQSICGNNGTVNSQSAYSQTGGFTTLGASLACPVPTGLSATNITASSALLGWTSTAAPMYVVRYRPANISAWTYTNSNTNSKMVGGLLPATQYEYQVQSKCNPNSAVNISQFSASHTFTTLNSVTNVICQIPGGLNTTNITSTSALLNWTSTGASGYNVKYRISGSNMWISIMATTNSLTLNGLTGGSLYEWQVQSVCPGINGIVLTSPFSGIETFSTPILISVFPDPAAGNLKIQLGQSSDNSLKVKVYDMLGTNVIHRTEQVDTGVSSTSIDISSLKRGVYFVEILNGTNKLTRRIFIDR